MSEFRKYSIEDSSGKRRAALEGVRKRYGMVPNVIAGMAASPAAVSGYIGLIDAMNQTSFTPTERHVIWFAINLEHGCHYCMSAHTPWAVEQGVAQDLIDTA